MKKSILILVLLFITFGCKETVIEKPSNLIEEDQMVNIIYDLSLLEAMKANDFSNQNKYPTATLFLKQKYKIDSLTFAKNTQYYASDVKNYKKMYDRIKARLQQETLKANGGNTQEPSTLK